MRKIDETFKSVIVLAEALNRLGINTEVVGFNDELYEYQNFGQPMSSAIREKMSGMFKEVEESCCSVCGNEHSETDLGWATQMAMGRLLGQKQDQKMLIILSDNMLSESPKHPREKYDPEKIKKEMLEKTDIVFIDIDTVAGKTVDEITEELKKLIEQKKKL
jgi:cobalamin biosynthesis protein CobT